VAYCVQDNGIGFDPKRAESLFEPLRADPADPLAGAGVGLATVQRIIARHGGTVWAESKPGSGASFCFTLVESAENLHFDQSL
jgi:signal transduction histidine kinase